MGCTHTKVDFLSGEALIGGAEPSKSSLEMEDESRKIQLILVVIMLAL